MNLIYVSLTAHGAAMLLLPFQQEWKLKLIFFSLMLSKFGTDVDLPSLGKWPSLECEKICSGTEE